MPFKNITLTTRALPLCVPQGGLRASLYFNALTLLMATGCSLFGGQTGEGDGTGPGCVAQQPVLLGLSEQSALGFSAKDILAFSATSDSSASWPASENEVTGTAPIEANLELTLTPQSERARYIKSVWGGEVPDADERCPDWLEIDVRASVALGNDAGNTGFAFDTTLTAKTAYLASFSENMSYAGQAEELQFVPNLPEEEVVGIFVSALFSPVGRSGSVEIITERTVVPEGYDPDARATSDAPQARPYAQEESYSLAYFPLHNACGGWNDDSGFWRYRPEIELDASQTELPVSLPELVEFFQFKSELTWQDGSQSLLESEATLTDGAACLSPEELSFGAIESAASLRVPLNFGLNSQDKRLSGEYSELVLVALGADGVEGLRLSISETELPAAQIADVSGLKEIRGEGLETADFHLELEIVPNDGNITGLLQLTTPGPPIANQPCKSSDDPCNIQGPGANDRLLERATW